uniref:Uncharacterized protein n=1 Tax=Oryza barthii TaxID=65489 RepID=A0A0D3HRR7_9ORYZ
MSLHVRHTAAHATTFFLDGHAASLASSRSITSRSNSGGSPAAALDHVGGGGGRVAVTQLVHRAVRPPPPVPHQPHLEPSPGQAPEPVAHVADNAAERHLRFASLRSSKSRTLGATAGEEEHGSGGDEPRGWRRRRRRHGDRRRRRKRRGRKEQVVVAGQVLGGRDFTWEQNKKN